MIKFWKQIAAIDRVLSSSKITNETQIAFLGMVSSWGWANDRKTELKIDNKALMIIIESI